MSSIWSCFASFSIRTFRELKDYVISMKSDKDEAPKEGEADVAKVTVLDAKNFEDSIKTGKLVIFNIYCNIFMFFISSMIFEQLLLDKIYFRCNIRKILCSMVRTLQKVSPNLGRVSSQICWQRGSNYCKGWLHCRRQCK